LGRFNDSGYASEREGWNEQREKERPILFSHGIPPIPGKTLSGRTIARVSGAKP
jgi:hypothetical protein